jgi:hypothetical protein
LKLCAQALVKSQRVVYEVVRCTDSRVNLFSAW